MPDDAKGTDYLSQVLDAPESAVEKALRPLSFADFNGQGKTKERLEVMVGAAKSRGEPLNHILLHGPPGLGKTTLAHILANEMEADIKLTSGPVIDKAGDLAGLLTSLQEGDILFIDEIHRIPKSVEEYLYSAMEDYRIDIMIDQGPNARSVRLSIPRFTLQTRLDYYNRDTLEKIVRRSCKLLGVPINDEGAAEVAGRARGTPRIANNLINFARDYAQQRANGEITGPVAGKALELLEIDRNGLDEMDKRILRLMAENYRGGPVGLGTVAVAVGEEQHTLEEVHEPFLIQEGYIARTPQGRVLTPKAWTTIGLKPEDAKGSSSLYE